MLKQALDDNLIEQIVSITYKIYCGISILLNMRICIYNNVYILYYDILVTL